MFYQNEKMKEEFQPSESLKLIESVINKTKRKYEDNGLTILIWGLLVFLAGTVQFFMIKTGNGAKSYWAWIFTMIPGFVITMVIKSREGVKQKKNTGDYDRSGLIWAFAGTCAMLTGFIFGEKFGIGFTAMIYIPFCVAGLATGLQLREPLFVGCSLIVAALSYGSLYLPFSYHPLVAAIGAIFLMIIPGIKLNNDYKKRQYV